MIRIRRLGAVILATLSLGLSVVSASAMGGGTPSAAPTTAPSAGSAVDNLGACLANKRSASVVFLVDESASLGAKGVNGGSDPQAARVTAASYLADQWARLNAETKGTINLAVVGFAQSTESVLGWTPVTAGTRSSVQGALDSLRTKDQGGGTDYWLALDQARQTLVDRPGHQPEDCQAIVWFTDGKLDASPTYETARGTARKPYAGAGVTTDAEASAAAQQDLCRSGGLADQIRSSRIATFAIGLQAGGSTTSDFELMKAVATGSAVAGSPCGKISDPVPGEFHLASDIDGLLFVFDRLRDPRSLPLDQVLGVCQGTVCPSQVHRFVLDASIGKVHLLASAGLDSADVYLVPPGGAPVAVGHPKPGVVSSVRVGSATVAVQWQTPRTVSLDLTPRTRESGWAGPWGVVFVDRTSSSVDVKSRTSLEISADLRPGWVAPPTAPVHAGEASAPVTFRVTTGAGAPVESSALLGTLSLSAVVVDSAGRTTSVVSNLDKASLSTPRRLDLSAVAEGSATLRVTLALTTAGATLSTGQKVAGTALAPQSVDLALPIAPPVGYPPVAQGAIDFGSLQSAADVQREVSVTGPGCAWVGDDGVTLLGAPQEAGAVTLTSTVSSPSSCLQVAAGQQAQLPLRLHTDHAANGALTGTVTVMTAPTGELTRARPVTLSWQASLAKPPDYARGLIVFVVALILGIGVPILLLYLVKWRSARIPERALQAQLIPVTITAGSVLRDGTTFALRSEDARGLVPIPAGGARSLSVESAQLVARTGLSPFGPGDADVSRVGSTAASSTHGVGRDGHATLPLAVHNTWVLFRGDGGQGAATADLLVLVGEDPRGDARARMTREILDQAPGLWARMGGTGGGHDDDPFAAVGASAPDPWSTPPPAQPAGGLDTGSQPRRPPDAGPPSAWSWDDPT